MFIYGMNIVHIFGQAHIKYGRAHKYGLKMEV